MRCSRAAVLSLRDRSRSHFRDPREISRGEFFHHPRFKNAFKPKNVRAKRLKPSAISKEGAARRVRADAEISAAVPRRDLPHNDWRTVPLERERTYLSIQQINATVSLYI